MIGLKFLAGGKSEVVKYPFDKVSLDEFMEASQGTENVKAVLKINDLLTNMGVICICNKDMKKDEKPAVVLVDAVEMFAIGSGKKGVEPSDACGEVIFFGLEEEDDKLVLVSIDKLQSAMIEVMKVEIEMLIVSKKRGEQKPEVELITVTGFPMF